MTLIILIIYIYIYKNISSFIQVSGEDWGLNHSNRFINKTYVTIYSDCSVT